MNGNGYAHTHLRMSEQTATAKGSPLNDLFKQYHKLRLPNHMFGSDIDFVIVEKNPDCIVAFKDLKRLDEGVTFAEVIAYNQLIRLAPLYLLYVQSESDVIAGKFDVHRYLGGNRGPNPPVVRTELYARITCWDEYNRWEQELRNATKRR